MHRAPWQRAVVVCAMVFTTQAVQAHAQSTGDLAAFSSLIVSPSGALPPSASDNGRALPDVAVIAVSYGRWRYDINDAIHHNLGATVTRRIGASATSVSLTAAYLSVSCDCAGWMSGGVSLTSRMLSIPVDRLRTGASGHIDLQLMTGGARYSGDGHASAYSVATAVDVGGSFLLRGSSRLAFSVIPGFGLGHLTSADETDAGTRPLLGAAISWRSRHGVSLDVGARRVVLKGGPTQFGMGIAWHAN
jgi:hypothetical protein